MNTEERKAARETHKRTANRWRRRYTALDARIDRLADKVRDIEKRAKDGAWGAVRLARALRLPMLAAASLSGSQARCDGIAGRHDLHARALAEPTA